MQIFKEREWIARIYVPEMFRFVKLRFAPPEREFWKTLRCHCQNRHAELVSASTARQTRWMRRERQPCVYILASGRNGTLYIGVTSDLASRLHQHRASDAHGFTGRYGVKRLVRFEIYEDMPTAIAREKQLKRWRRDWKCNLIEQDNPDWADLAIVLDFAPSDEDSRAVDAETSSA